MAITAEALAKELGITPQALRRKLRALNLGHAKGKSWTWEDDSPEFVALKEQLKSGAAPKAKKPKDKPTAKKPTKKAAKKSAKKPVKKAAKKSAPSPTHEAAK